ncbi:hypothetical protein [Streptobacillus canis]|uniref:hypothetical protein n=1 Tax=Streptobacillus canis TaxID=2678686 RepID=UPI0012E2F249|nr:hypothetical protein [Streptobacillus canis]
MKILEEYEKVLAQKNEIEKVLPTLLNGYISIKTIKGKKYSYLQNRVNNKIKSKYLRENEIDGVREELELYRMYKENIPKIEGRLKELEQAAKIVDKNIYRELRLIKMANTLDLIDEKQKKESVNFADAISSIEGVDVTEKTQKKIESWLKGEKSYLTIFEETLKMYKNGEE